jgi:hypothetical protein
MIRRPQHEQRFLAEAESFDPELDTWYTEMAKRRREKAVWRCTCFEQFGAGSVFSRFILDTGQHTTAGHHRHGRLFGWQGASGPIFRYRAGPVFGYRALSLKRTSGPVFRYRVALFSIIEYSFV